MKTCRHCKGPKTEHTRIFCGPCILSRLMKYISALALVLYLFTPSASAFIDEITATRIILGESEGEPQAGRIATAEVLRRRDSTKGFYGLNAVHFDGKNYLRGKRIIDHKTTTQALDAWKQSARTNYTKGATHFENIKAFGQPKWAKNMKQTATIGNHVFFKN